MNGIVNVRNSASLTMYGTEESADPFSRRSAKGLRTSSSMWSLLQAFLIPPRRNIYNSIWFSDGLYIFDVDLNSTPQLPFEKNLVTNDCPKYCPCCVQGEQSLDYGMNLFFEN